MIIFFLSLAGCIVYHGPLTDLISLTPGKYYIECIGAQGGTYSSNKPNYRGNYSGGLGAKTSGYINVSGQKEITFYINVGGQPAFDDSIRSNPGGFNGGGKSGQGTYAPTSAGGGGATDIRIFDNSLANRIMVAAGGSGAVCFSNGAQGGLLQGFCHSEKSDGRLAYSSSTTQNSGGANGIGEQGKAAEQLPGSGGGGGWMGGKASLMSGAQYETYLVVADSGSSYISGHHGCIAHPSITFLNPIMTTNHSHRGNGQITITEIFKCKDNCISCNSKDTCEQCVDGYLYSKTTNECVTQCPDGTYKSDHNTCELCSDACKTCSDNFIKCTSCNEGYALYENQCYTNCPHGYYSNNYVCEKCDSNCLLCTQDECLSCQQDYYLYNGKCLSSCPAGLYQLGSHCYNCPYGCNYCEYKDSLHVCEQCKTGFFLYNNRCYENCPSKTRNDGSKCVDCNESCVSCSSGINICDACVNDQLLFNGQCYDSCPSGTYKTGNICSRCSTKCYECTDKTDKCTSCNPNLYLFNNECYSECPPGTKPEDGKCV